MRQTLFGLLSILATSISVNAQVWVTKSTNIRFFSATPVEDIEAVSKTSAGALNTKTGKIFFKAAMKSFNFDKALMQEHFNENYMESDKFPHAEFDGLIQDLPDLSKDGDYPVKIVGKLTMHGVSKDRTIAATLKVANGGIHGKSVFKVKVVDHNIEIPKLVVQNIAEEIEVTINAEFIPKQK